MNVRCGTCETVYRVDPNKVPTGGVRARCSVCQSVIQVLREDGAAAAASAAAPPPAAPVAQTPPPVATPTSSGPRGTPVLAPRPTPEPGPPKPRLTQPAKPVATPAAAPPRPSAPVFRPTPGRPATPAPPVPPKVTAPVAAPATPPASPQVAAQRPPAPSGKTQGRVVNPFLAQDPRQKARRLARALVSDMIVYQPEKRQKALAEGNLKSAFGEEIKKSWEEYVEQVGTELANSTSFFNDALNEILAGGQKVF